MLSRKYVQPVFQIGIECVDIPGIITFSESFFIMKGYEKRGIDLRNLLLAVFCSSALTLMLKAADMEKENRYAILLGNYLICTILSWVCAPDHSGFFSLSLTAVLLALCGGVLFLLGLISISRSIAVNGAAMTASFAKLGMTVTILISVVFFQEQIRFFTWLGILCSISAVIVIYQPSERSVISLSLLLFTLLTNGLADAMAKFFSALCQPQEENGFLFLLFSTAGILTLFLAFREKRHTGKPVVSKTFLYGCLAGIPNFFSSFFLIHALKELPAVAAAPLFSVGTIAAVLLVSVFFFHERLTPAQGKGMILIAAALVLLNLQEVMR